MVPVVSNAEDSDDFENDYSVDEGLHVKTVCDTGIHPVAELNQYDADEAEMLDSEIGRAHV